MPTVYLIRHAQASFGKSDYDRLSPMGERQAALLGKTLVARGVSPAVVVSGSMRRHAQTAALAGFAPEIDRGFDEFDHEEIIVAHKPAYFQEMFTAATERWVRGGDGYTESFADFCERSEAAIRRTAERLGKGETAVVFTSGGPIAAVVSRLLSGGDDLWPSLNPVTINTAITKVVSGRSDLTVVSYNEHAHLDGTELLSYR
ncbi:histidine phosphatase family protein [Kribbella turkmenica]|uniref:Histidine phosphatase family protein n=1 Tax=Kribbella turkmenica TaxID=2530375 RepID=A0A4V2YGP1_9ACTN|nr:histidine phosphatase family protein [Kribbella turkmenica]TDD27827.1 histidine phosphatase family protein [Kribbella turkmenica]